MTVPAWKKSRVVAGAMMLVKGYVQPVSICDHCQRTLARADGCINVAFEAGAAHYACPHCWGFSVRPVGVR